VLELGDVLIEVTVEMDAAGLQRHTREVVAPRLKEAAAEIRHHTTTRKG
jgi:hypothetical protein